MPGSPGVGYPLHYFPTTPPTTRRPRAVAGGDADGLWRHVVDTVADQGSRAGWHGRQQPIGRDGTRSRGGRSGRCALPGRKHGHWHGRRARLAARRGEPVAPGKTPPFARRAVDPCAVAAHEASLCSGCLGQFWIVNVTPATGSLSRLRSVTCVTPVSLRCACCRVGPQIVSCTDRRSLDVRAVTAVTIRHDAHPEWCRAPGLPSAGNDLPSKYPTSVSWHRALC